jgi:hypothetical protein
MAYKPSESRYDGGGRVVYLEYSTPSRARGTESTRRRAKRIYLPADSKNLSLEGPKTLRKRTGRSVHGVALHYEHVVGAARARRGNTSYKLPERTSERTKVIEVPAEARDLRLTDKAPKGLVGVA